MRKMMEVLNRMKMIKFEETPDTYKENNFEL